MTGTVNYSRKRGKKAFEIERKKERKKEREREKAKTKLAPYLSRFAGAEK